MWVITVDSLGATTLKGENAKENINRRMVYRVRQRLGAEIADTRGRHHPYNEWALADVPSAVSDRPLAACAPTWPPNAGTRSS
jgi:hypothetical protein